MPTLHIDDAIEHLVGHLRDGITEPTPAPVITDKRGCDLWLPIVVAKFWQSRGHPTFTAYPREQQDADIGYFRPFYDGMGALPDRGSSAGTNRPNGKHEGWNRVSRRRLQSYRIWSRLGANRRSASAERPEPV